MLQLEENPVEGKIVMTTTVQPIVSVDDLNEFKEIKQAFIG